jgi:hypothetical protein
VRTRVIALLLVLAAVAALFSHWGPSHIGPHFHEYADRRSFLGIPNALDVLSNAPFVVVGLLGLGLVARRRAARPPRWLFAVAFASVLGVGLGSSLYHLHPTDETLLWDWLPLATMFAAFLAIVLADRVHPAAGTRLGPLLCAIAAGSALLWYATGDMRCYVLVQLLGVVTLALALVLFPPGRMPTRTLIAALGAYLVARLFTAHDGRILAAIGVSGHTLKHLAAGLATGLLLIAARPCFEREGPSGVS